METVTPQPPAYHNDKIAEQKHEPVFDDENGLKHGEVADAFGNEEYAEIKYKTLKWWYVSLAQWKRTMRLTHGVQAMWYSHDLRVRLAGCLVAPSGGGCPGSGAVSDIQGQYAEPVD